MATLLRIVAVVASVVILVGLMAFAADEAERGSAAQVESIDPSAGAERKREGRSEPVREVIDDANDVLVSPFAGIVTSRDPWGPRIVSGGLAFLLFGVGGTLLANALPRPRHKVADWREATS